MHHKQTEKISRAQKRGLRQGNVLINHFSEFICESMSVHQTEIFVQTKENALREFSFIDEETVPLVSISIRNIRNES